MELRGKVVGCSLEILAEKEANEHNVDLSQIGCPFLQTMLRDDGLWDD